MIDRLRLFARLVTFAAALGIVAAVVWDWATGAKQIEPLLIAVWLLIVGVVAQLGLWVAHQMARRS